MNAIVLLLALWGLTPEPPPGAYCKPTEQQVQVWFQGCVKQVKDAPACQSAAEAWAGQYTEPCPVEGAPTKPSVGPTVEEDPCMSKCAQMGRKRGACVRTCAEILLCNQCGEKCSGLQERCGPQCRFDSYGRQSGCVERCAPYEGTWEECIDKCYAGPCKGFRPQEDAAPNVPSPAQVRTTLCGQECWTVYYHGVRCPDGPSARHCRREGKTEYKKCLRACKAAAAAPPQGEGNPCDARCWVRYDECKPECLADPRVSLCEIMCEHKRSACLLQCPGSPGR